MKLVLILLVSVVYVSAGPTRKVAHKETRKVENQLKLREKLNQDAPIGCDDLEMCCGGAMGIPQCCDLLEHCDKEFADKETADKDISDEDGPRTGGGLIQDPGNRGAADEVEGPKTGGSQ